jgi:hypothetical protein
VELWVLSFGLPIFMVLWAHGYLVLLLIAAFGLWASLRYGHERARQLGLIGLAALTVVYMVAMFVLFGIENRTDYYDDKSPPYYGLFIPIFSAPVTFLLGLAALYIGLLAAGGLRRLQRR